MSGILKDRRQELADAIAADLTRFKGHAKMPARIVPPCVVVVPGSPYLVKGDTVGTVTMRAEAHLIVGALNNDTSADLLDDVVDDAIVAGINGDWRFQEVLEPYGLSSGGAVHLAIPVIFTKPGIRL